MSNVQYDNNTTQRNVVEIVERTTENVDQRVNRPEDFEEAVIQGAHEMKPDLAALRELDAKYELDAEIHNVRKEKPIAFDVAIERGAAQVQTANTIEGKKETTFNAIDKGAEKLKLGVETVADSTKSAALQTRENVEIAQDKARENAEWAKEKIQTNVEYLKEKTFDVVQKVQEGVSYIGEKIGLTQPLTPDFNTQIAVGATEMKVASDREKLEELDRKYELDAEIKTVRNVPFGTAIQREAAEKHAAHVIESKKEGAHSVIDAGAEKLKVGVEYATQSTVNAAHKAQESVNWTKDKVQENVDILKEKAAYGTELAKEKARENINYTIAKAEEGKEIVADVVQRVQETAVEGVQRIQEGAILLGENIGVLPMREGNFDQAIRKGAVEMHAKLDMDNLRELDAEHQLDAKIDTVYRVGFDTEIERGASKMQTGRNIDTAKEATLGVIDRGAAKLKQAVEAVADSAKSVAFSTHDNVNAATDRARLNVDLAKEGVQRNVEVIKERALENMDWAKANTIEAKERLVDTAQRTQQTVQEKVNNLGEQVRSIPEGTYGLSGDFNKSVAIGAMEMKATRDMDKLHDLDAKYELDADISTVRKPNFDTEIQRAAAKTQATHKIESAKEDIFGAIDKAATNLKQGVDVTAENAKTITHNTQQGIYSTKDKIQENIDLAKDNAEANLNLVKERTKQSVERTKAQVDQGTEVIVNTVQSAKGRLVGGNFDAEIAKGAREMPRDMSALKEIDEKHQLDAKITTPHHVDFKTEIKREADHSHTSRKIEGVKEDVYNSIDRGVATLKEGVQSVADKSKAVAYDAQEKKFQAEDKIEDMKLEAKTATIPNKSY
jgi:hypothetical protein